jgi:hypothetical protein
MPDQFGDPMQMPTNYYIELKSEVNGETTAAILPNGLRPTPFRVMRLCPAL